MKIRDKGFVVTMAVCALAVGAVAAVSLANALPKKGEEVPPVSDATTASETLSTTATTAVQDVQNPVTNVPDLRVTTTTTPTTTGTTAAPVAGLYVLPLTNEVCRSFSTGDLVFSETMQDWRVHNGVDFVGKEGDTVKAAATGRVSAIYEDVLWGDVIEIDHGYGITSRYGGVSARSIAVGDTVAVGDPIGVLTTVPCEAADGPHLHLEVLSGEQPQDVVAFIGLEVRYAE